MATNPKRAPDTQQRWTIRAEHPLAVATSTVKAFKAARPMIVDSVRYLSPTATTEHASTSYTGTAAKGATTFATLFDTDADGAGDNGIAANTWIDGSLDVDSVKRAFDAGDECNLVITRAGGVATSGVDATDNELDFAAAHGFTTGDEVRLTTTGGLPGGLALATSYFVIDVDSDSISLATTLANALVPTEIDFSSAGTGVQTVHKVLPAGCVALEGRWL